MNARFDWEAGFNSQLVLGKIADCRKVSQDGRVSFNSHDYQFWLPVLESAVRSSAGLGHLKHRCIVQALNDASLTLKDRDAFLQRCNKAYDQLSSRPTSEFVVVMSLTYSGQPLFTRMTDGDVYIRWQANPNSKFIRVARKAREGLADIRRNHNVPEEPPETTNLLLHVSAYDSHHAHDIATESTDSLRGMLNLFVNSNRGVNPFARLVRPHAVNRFRSGPYRTVHKVDGSLATETLWYEHRWLHESPTVKFTDEGREKFKKNLQGWWLKLQNNPLRNHIRQGLLRYCRALDLHDTEPALLEMWGALESLTGTQREKYDVTVNRTIQLFIDRDDARQVAHHVRLRRNSTIHAARTLNREEADAILIHAETLVSRVLFFCLREGKRFVNEAELFRFLDLSLDKTTLKRRVALSKFFVEYQERRQEKS
jgi:hypothetical protein